MKYQLNKIKDMLRSTLLIYEFAGYAIAFDDCTNNSGNQEIYLTVAHAGYNIRILIVPTANNGFVVRYNSMFFAIKYSELPDTINWVLQMSPINKDSHG